MTPTTPVDPQAVAQDPGCPDTPADTQPGSLGMLAHLLRALFARYLPPWFYPPNTFRPFDYQASITTPAIGVTATVVSVLVPTGFTGCVRRLSCNIIGPGFVQGSGALIWSVQVSKAPVKGYAQILNELGSPQQARPCDGILADSAQLIEITCQNVSYLAGGTMVNASLAGWHYPKVVRRRA